MGETNSPSVGHVGYDISPLLRVKFKILATRLTARGYFFNLTLLSGEISQPTATEGEFICILVYKP